MAGFPRLQAWEEVKAYTGELGYTPVVLLLLLLAVGVDRYGSS
jgi:hypothetical protein